MEHKIINIEQTKKFIAINRLSFVLIVVLFSLIIWCVTFVICSLVSIYFIDHTFAGWFIRYDEISDEYSLTLWSWIFISIVFLVIIFEIWGFIEYGRELSALLHEKRNKIKRLFKEKNIVQNSAKGISFDFFSDKTNELIKKK